MRAHLRTVSRFLSDYFTLFFSLAVFFHYLVVLVYYPLGHVLENYLNKAPAVAGFCFLILIAFKYILARLLKWRQGPAEVLDRGFFFFLCLLGGVSCFYLNRLAYYCLPKPIPWFLCMTLAGTAIAWLMPKRFFFQKLAFLLAFLNMFGIGVVTQFRITIPESSLQPPTSTGIRVVSSLTDAVDRDNHPKSKKTLFGLLPVPTQYGYLALDKEEKYLFADAFCSEERTGTIYKISLSDYRLVATFRDQVYFRDRIPLEDPDCLLVANWRPFNPKNTISVLRLSDLKRVGSLDLGIRCPQNIQRLDRREVLITSETGRVLKLPGIHQQPQMITTPTFPQEVSYDKARGILAIASLGGYSLLTLDVENMRVLNRRVASFSSWGVAIDSDKGRIFLTRTFLGDLLVCDVHSLKTIATVALEPGLRIVAYVEPRQLVVVGNYINGNLYFIDGNSYQLLRTVWVGSMNRSIKYSSLRDCLYVSTALRILEIDLAALFVTSEVVPLDILFPQEPGKGVEEGLQTAPFPPVAGHPYGHVFRLATEGTS